MPKITDQNMVVRPPVVVVMGHIDHGKSSLLDYIRKTDIVAKESGGITQHVGAYETEYKSSDGKSHSITFLDTPGHAAFCSIRERGAQAADIAILVVSAEDGVKPQTVEAFKEIKLAGIPFIVAISKIDKPNADVNRAKQTLGEHEIYVEGWGGDVPCIPISSVTGEGINELLEMIVLMSELKDQNTRIDLPAAGVIIESSLDNRKGISATLLIKEGTLKIGSFVVAESTYAPVRYIENYLGKKVDTASPSMPAKVVGWTSTPECGAIFTTVLTKKEAEQLTEEFANLKKKKRSEANPLHIDEEKENGNKIVEVPLIIKADVIGSLEGVKHELAKIHHDKVSLKIISEAVGDINENDIKLASSNSNITVVGFNVVPDSKASPMIDRSPVPLNIKTFKIIYELTEFVKTLFESHIPKEYVEEVTGRARILAVFSKDKDKQILGGKVESGVINLGNDVRIIRREAEIGRGRLRELQEKKIKAKEVAEGHEFGMLLDAKIEVAAGDKIEAVKTVEKKA